MIKVAFASTDRTRVNQHFGSAEGFAVFDITPTSSALVAVAEFPPEAQDGNENKLITKVEFLVGCQAVFAQAIGASAIKQLMAQGVQPIRVAEVDCIDAIIAEIQEGMREGGIPWIDRALARDQKSPDRFAQMEEEGWEG